MGRVTRVRASGEGNVYFDLASEGTTYVVKQDANSFANVFSLLQLAVANNLDVVVLNEEPYGEYLKTDDIIVS